MSRVKCRDEVHRVFKKLAEFCNDGEAVEVIVRQHVVIVRSIDVPGKEMRISIRQGCRNEILNALREGNIVVEVCSS